MTIQTRNIYQTGNPELDRIINDLAQRLDVLEGIRPDLDTGYLKLEEEKTIDTEDPLSGYIQEKNGLGFDDYQIDISGGSLVLTDSNIEVENGIIKVTIGASGGAIEIYDVNSELIHKLS